MNHYRRLCSSLVLFALACTGCDNLHGKPAPDSIRLDPEEISDFAALYAKNCAGCHGTDGKGGASIALADPAYLAIADDSVLRRVATSGVAGTSMPAFAKSAGGMLTDKQIDIIVRGIREHWSNADALRGTNPPSYSAPGAGDPSRGADVYASYCSSCHGPGGRGGQKASSIVDGSYLALVSDQNLRTVVIVGRPELGAPDWRGNIPGKPMSSQDVSDVVSWLGSQRPRFPGEPSPSSVKSAGGVP